MLDLEDRIRDYCSYLEDLASPVAADEILVETVVASPSSTALRRWPAWLIAPAAAAALLLAGAAILLIGALGNSEPASPSPTSTTVPEVQTTTTVVEPSATPATTTAPTVTIPPLEASLRIVARTTHTEDIDRTNVVWYLDEDTWRWETPVWQADGSNELEGHVMIWAEGQVFDYYPSSNTYEIRSEPPNLGEAGTDLLAYGVQGALFDDVSFVCDEQGICSRYAGSDLWPGCNSSPGESIAGRPTIYYVCHRTNQVENNVKDLTVELWQDIDTGRTLKQIYFEIESTGAETRYTFEVVELDLEPVFTADLFEFECPTSDCVSQEEANADPYFWVTLVQGEVAPDFHGDLFDGGTFSTADLPARPTLVYFWYDYCETCTDLLDELQQLANEVAGDAEFVAVMLSGDLANGTRIIADGDYTFTAVEDVTNDSEQRPEIEDKWGVDAVPVWVLLDGQRTVIDVFHWESTPAQREAALTNITR